MDAEHPVPGRDPDPRNRPRQPARLTVRWTLIALAVGLCLLIVSGGRGRAAPKAERASTPGAALVAQRASRASRPECPSPRRPSRGGKPRGARCRKPEKDNKKRATARKKPAPKKPAPKAPAPAAAYPRANPPAAPPATALEPSQPAGVSAWAPPALTNPTIVTLSDSNRSVKLNQSQDYIVRCPPGQFDVSGRINIWGGHNVVFENCNEYVTNPTGDWAGYLQNQTGTLWIHDVHFGGAHLTGGVQFQEPGATVVMRDVLFDTVYGSYQTNHAECAQTWSGPARFLIDGLQCSTTYQGLFLLPNQWDSTTLETTWDFRNVQINGDGAFDLWLGDVQPSNLGSLPAFNLQNVYDCGSGEPRDYDGTSDNNQAWAGVKSCPAGGVSPFVWSNADGSVSGRDDGVAPAALVGEQP
ncbi:MAG: hypothetical protein JO027_06175 [Solirubrobacterales bacterium]|nr:hypothetical protein [Solirubrobacterales bacterium]